MKSLSRFALLAALFCVWTSPGLANPPRPGAHLSVTAVEADSAAGQTNAELFAQVLEGRIAALGRYTLLERRNIAAILEEQGFQQSGACNTSECQVQVGQLLGVEYIVNGQIRKSGLSWFLNFRITDVGTGQITASSDFSMTGDFDAVLSDGLSRVMQDLFGVISRFTVSKPGYAGLTLQWNDDATLLVREVNGLGQAYAAGLRPGQHIVSVNGARPRPGQEECLGEAGTLVTLGLVQGERQPMRQIAVRLTDKTTDDSLSRIWSHRNRGGAWTWIGLESGFGAGTSYSLLGTNMLMRMTAFPAHNPLNLYAGITGTVGLQYNPAFLGAIEIAVRRTRMRLMGIWGISFAENSAIPKGIEIQTIYDPGLPAAVSFVFGLGSTRLSIMDNGVRESVWLPLLVPSVGLAYRWGG